MGFVFGVDEDLINVGASTEVGRDYNREVKRGHFVHGLREKSSGRRAKLREGYGSASRVWRSGSV